MKLKENIKLLHDSMSGSEYDYEEIDQCLFRVLGSIKAILKTHDHVSEDQLKHFINQSIVFEWTDDAKHSCILLRDIRFRLYRDRLMVLCKRKSRSDFVSDNKKTTKLINAVFLKLITQYEDINNQTEVDKEKLNKWKHYSWPVGVIQEQIDTLIDQLELILMAESRLLGYQVKMEELVSLTIENLNLTHTSSKELNQSIGDIIEAIKSTPPKTSKETIERLNKYVDDQYDKLENLKKENQSKKPEVEDIQSFKFPSNIREGELIVKEISISRQTNNWIESDIYPSVLDLRRTIDLTFDRVLTTLFGIRNRISLYLLEEADIIDFPNELLLEALADLPDQTTKLYQDVSSITSILQEKIEENLNVANIFDVNTLFIRRTPTVSLQRYRHTSDKWLNYIKPDNIRQSINRGIEKLLSSTIESTSHTALIDYIESRRIHQLDQYSHSLFLNKGYLGKSFIVPREDILSILSKSLKNWQNGYRGSCLIFGRRLSGRSTITESIDSEIQDVTSLRLKPWMTLTLGSSQLNIKSDLKGAIQFVEKYAQQDKLLIFIDDLEIWRSTDIHLLDNVQALLEAMNNYSDRFYFCVSTNHWLKELLDNYFQFSDDFASICCTDIMSAEAIQKATMIRHEASLKEVTIDRKLLEDIKPLRSQAKKIARKSQYNIGASLQEWCRLNIVQGDYVESDHGEVPSEVKKLVSDHWTLLSHIMRLRMTNESELARLIGPVYVKRVHPEIQKLCSYRILKRNRRGDVSINEFIVDNIELAMINEMHKNMSTYA